jgi:hypothetical protein
MEGMKGLIDAIQDIHVQNKSGVLMVGTQRGTSEAGAPSTYTLRFEGGELARMSVGGQLQGLDALASLLGVGALGQLRWFPLGINSKWHGNAQISRENLFGTLHQALGVVSKERVVPDPHQPGIDSDHALISHVKEVFRDVYLGDFEADLAQIAKNHPPASEPAEYLDACAQLLAPMVGEKAAKKMLS